MWDWVFDSKGLHPQSLTEIVILMVGCLFVASSPTLALTWFPGLAVILIGYVPR